jgi:hypothetical protein
MNGSTSFGELLSFRGTHDTTAVPQSSSCPLLCGESFCGFGVPVDLPLLMNAVKIPQQKVPEHMDSLDDVYSA